MNLFTDLEFNTRFLDALNRISESTFEAVVRHEHRETVGPRVSGLGSCARKQYYNASGTMETDPRDPTGAWASTLGNFGQSLAAMVLREMGYEVKDEELEVTLEDGLIVGHIDGLMSGLDLGDAIAVWDSKFKSIWGMVGTKNSYGIAVDGLPWSDPAIYLQLQTYLLATEATVAIVTAHPFDFSALRTQAAIKKIDASPVYRLVLETDEEAQQLALHRGKMVAVAVSMGEAGLPMREFDPARDNFPCNYCEWKSKCVADGGGFKLMFPPIPERMRIKPVEVSA